MIKTPIIQNKEKIIKAISKKEKHTRENLLEKYLASQWRL